ncbi:MAG: hypothetical protein AB1449_09715 [Chloroflexota bacterium]
MPPVDAPANTFDFMVLGYAVILGTIALFLASLVIRFRNLRQDLEVLEGLESRKKP